MSSWLVLVYEQAATANPSPVQVMKVSAPDQATVTSIMTAAIAQMQSALPAGSSIVYNWVLVFGPAA